MKRILLVLVLLLPFANAYREAVGQTEPPLYLNPLDVTVNKDGAIAEVILAGPRKLAIVDLKQGRVEELRTLKDKDWTPSEIAEHGTVNPDSWDTNYDGRRHAGAVLRAFWQENTPPGERNFSANWLGLYRYARTQVPTTQISQGWVFVSAIRHFSPSLNGELRVVALDERQRAYADPSDLVLSSQTDRAFVAVAGADLVLAIDLANLRNALKNPTKDDSFDLTTARHFILARIPTGPNPRRLGISGDGKTLVVSNYLGDSLTVIDAEKLKVIKQISLGGPELDAARRGERLFNSAKMTFQGQFTCASCHPNGGSDGLNWDLTRDGVGNFLNTRSLHGVRDTAPYGWLASSPTLADRVAGTLRTLHRHEPQGTEVEDIVAYLKSLDPPKPLAVSRSERIERGQNLFQGKAKCSTCHRRDALDDSAPHDVGTRVIGDVSDSFDTPSLRGVSRTAPYLHHGQAQTLEEVLTKHNPRHHHGAAHLLTSDELADLIAFLKGL